MKRIYTPVKKKTILLVDDNQIAVHLYREKLQSQGLKVEVAVNAASAMKTLTEGPVDLLILDLCLPGMNGVEVLKNIRSVSGLEALPVIVFSNAYLGSLGRAALEAGATKCVTKVNTTPRQMADIIRELLGIDVTAEAASSNVNGTLETEVQEQQIKNVLSNAPETLAELRISYQVFAKTEPADLQKAELIQMHRLIRLLAGSAGLLGLRKIAQMANAFEGLLIELHAKPPKITPSVIRTVARAIDTLASLFDHSAKSETDELVPPRILVVDDEIISREAICSALAKANLTAESLGDPIAAERLLEQHHFDLIFLDVEMPGQSGLELCMKIRETTTNHATPVVFVTAHSDFGSRAQSTLSGGNEFIAKPFLLVELAVKALTLLFKESPQLGSTATSQDSTPVKTADRESESTVIRAGLSIQEAMAFEPDPVS